MIATLLAGFTKAKLALVLFAVAPTLREAPREDDRDAFRAFADALARRIPRVREERA